ncbi:DUF2812 domain-containing protein [Sporosarcina sp. Te-1]|uniref:DUF2812 domain-containing protein n=1 Tax=Sporosarcina sp. Te-1 TaxID=2818390 RepID=UPI001A9D4832|nr:DUF2812 domain-containing protein [Sporosarcina sp. Te-1]QTD40303.1 DUF2812 domain-containing protein [Sporosarcina sp. Te-1]
MTRTKYIYSGGWAFTEQQDMDRLREHAREGWLLDHVQFAGYVLRKGEPQDLEYSLDYQKHADEEYFSIFEMSGWTHVCSVGNETHIFSAPAGTVPIYTDKMTTVEKYKRQKRVMGKIALPALLITLLLFSIGMQSDQSWVPTVITDACGVLSYLSGLVLLFTGMPYIGYSYKVFRLRRG